MAIPGRCPLLLLEHRVDLDKPVIVGVEQDLDDADPLDYRHEERPVPRLAIAERRVHLAKALNEDRERMG
jgi:hypothetical protein